MSDNNVNNNQNPQPAYQSFNEYPQGAPAQPIYIAANGVNPNYANEQKARSLGIWGLVLSIVSPCCCYIPAFVGLGLSIAGIKKNSKSVISIVALIFNILVIGYLVYRTVYTAMHPEETQQATQQLTQMMEEMMQQMQQQQQAGGQPVPTDSILRMFFR